MKILVVEDNDSCMLFLRQTLTCADNKCVIEVDCATTGEDALQMFNAANESKNPYTLIFMDIMLPGIDGLQTLEKIRAIENGLNLTADKKVKAIITTALDDSTKASRAFFQGEAISYMTKPITKEKILEELKKFGLM